MSDQLPSFLSENYRFVRQIIHGGSTVVYQAISTRGRLRGRQLALKRFIPPEKGAPFVSLHQSLCHPNIAALHFVVSSSNIDYHILELCPEGNLRDLLSSRNPPVLSENELRLITKGIASALAYLKEGRVIHRNICSSNVLLAEGFKPKICDFKHAVYLYQEDKLFSQPFTLATHPAPEMLKFPSLYDCAVDAWAFGCVLYSCIDGANDDPPELSPEIMPLVLNRRSPELQDLVISLLASTMEKRLKADDIMKHPYFTMGSFATNLDFSSERPQETSASHKHLQFSSSRVFSPLLSSGHDQRALSEVLKPPLRLRYATSFQQPSRERHILKDITNVPLQQFLSTKSTSSKDVVSTSVKRNRASPEDEKWEVSPCSFQIAETPLARREQVTAGPNNDYDGRSSVNMSSLPIGTTRPLPVETLSLVPKTHKLATGSITILPSHSLLVDFRENQRRQGLKGDQVLLIDPQGVSIKIFSAPHLSVPSCLVEPVQQYNINVLPCSYWKQYNDAAHFIDQIKQKTPQMSVYKSSAKCTLMSNSPLADIEVTLYGEESSEGKARIRGPKTKDRPPIMRIRFPRQRRFVEIAEQLTEKRDTEWKKECRTCHDSDTISTLLLSHDLSALAKKGLGLLSEFLPICEQFEEPHSSTKNNLTRTEISSVTLPELPLSLSSVKIPLRPQKIQGISSPLGSVKSSALRVDASPPAPHTIKQSSLIGIQDLLSETRYLSSVGWCIRYHGHDASKDMKYQIMFVDGVCLEADLHKNHLSLSSLNGDTIRCKISDQYSHPEVEKHVRFLEDFIYLYDRCDIQLESNSNHG
ncbi:kinase-like domain-containing protein [Flammula alnicola]|nr:kinase-like domain-containing protein [Flammula alnicola]